MNRVVITGMGIVSSLGANKLEVLESLKSAKSGIEFSEKYQEMGLRSNVHGSIPEIDAGEVIDRKTLRFMADAAIYNAIALDEAIKESGLRGTNFLEDTAAILVEYQIIRCLMIRSSSC